MKLLITTPFLNRIGGTEIETLVTAQELMNSGKFNSIEVFCPGKIDLTNYDSMNINHNISFITYPYFFKNRYVMKADTFINRLFFLNTSFLENFYWFVKRLTWYNYVYILSYTNQDYYLPILNNFDPKICLIKYTIVYKEQIKFKKKKLLKLLKWNLVANYDNLSFMTNLLCSNNVINQDIIIANEKRLLQSHSNRSYTFGILSRFSKEKRIELAIALIRELNLNGSSANLIIQGDGDENYFYHLQKMVVDYGLMKQITLIKSSIPPANTHLFYKQISFFLITSRFETGPLTGLEAMAAGVPILSYNVGAMSERLGKHSNLIVRDFEDMLLKARNLIHLNKVDYEELSKSIRENYKMHCSNAPKISSLENLFFNKN